MLACNTNKSVAKNTVVNKAVSICPDDGQCAFEVLKNKNFNMKTDEFGNGYSEVIDGNNTVLKFEYKKNTTPDVQDGNYSEIIYIEIDSNLSSIQLEGKALSSVKAGFSRLCYCKGQTGTYPIRTGSLSITKLENNSYDLVFNFTVSEVPQIINAITETFEL